MKLDVYEVIQKPLITEKGAADTERFGKYAFTVHKAANKKQVKAAIEKIFNVHVTKVNVLNQQGKWRRIRFQPGRTPEWKKAIVTIRKGEKIDIAI